MIFLMRYHYYKNIEIRKRLNLGLQHQAIENKWLKIFHHFETNHVPYNNSLKIVGFFFLKLYFVLSTTQCKNKK